MKLVDKAGGKIIKNQLILTGVDIAVIFQI